MVTLVFALEVAFPKRKQALKIFHELTPVLYMIIKSLDPLRAKKTFIRKKLGHTMVSAIKASSVTL